jgi:ankyrin repeat protein
MSFFYDDQILKTYKFRDINDRLIYACDKENIYAVEDLLERGANPNAKAITNKPISDPTYFGSPTTALEIAVDNEHYTLIELLLRYGANPNGGMDDLAGHVTNVKIMRLLLNYGLKIQDDTVPFLLSRDIKIARFMLQENGYSNKINFFGEDEETALMIACDNYNLEMVEFLLNSGADPNIQNSSGVTALMIICEFREKRSPQIIKLLLDFGADITLTNDEGKTAMTIAVEKNYDEAINLLEEQRTKLYFTDFSRLRENIRPKNYSFGGVGGDTPLIIACEKGDLKTVKQLFSSSDINHQNIKGQTALHHASVYGHNNIVTFLLENGVNSTLKDDGGNTYLDIKGRLKRS